MKRKNKQHRKDFSIVTFPDKILKEKTKKVISVDQNIKDILETMLSTMYNNSGIGLAAPQVGLNLNLAVVDAGDGVCNLINPVIIEKDGKDTIEEGCLSLPSVSVSVTRAQTVKVRYTNENDQQVVKTFSGLTAKAVQHEMDHLKGKLIVDYLPWFKRFMFFGFGKKK